MRVEVEVQPDREDAERDNAGVEVAAHVFLVSLRAACSFVFCEPFARLAPPRALCRRCAAGSRLGVQWHLTPIAYRAAIKNAQKVCSAARAAWYAAYYAAA